MFSIFKKKKGSSAGTQCLSTQESPASPSVNPPAAGFPLQEEPETQPREATQIPGSAAEPSLPEEDAKETTEESYDGESSSIPMPASKILEEDTLENEAVHPAEASAEQEQHSDVPENHIAMPENVEPAIPAGPAARLYTACASAAPLVLLLLAAVMTGITVWLNKGIPFFGDARIADAANALSLEDCFLISAGGLACTDLAPLYVWFVKGLSLIPGIAPAMAPLVAAALSCAAFIISIWCTAIAAGTGKKAAFAAGLIALCSLPVCLPSAGLGPDMFFAMLSTSGMAFLYRGWIKRSAPMILAAGFVLLGFSVMAKSPFSLAAAIATSIVFLFLRGTPGRLNGRDGIPGFLLMLLMIAGWLSTLYLNGNASYLHDMLGVQLLPRIIGPAASNSEWHAYLIIIPAAFLPWTLLPLFANWPAVFRGIPKAWHNRRANGGLAWLWTWFLSSAAILCCLQEKNALYALPLLAPASVLAGRSLMKLSPARSRCFFGLTSAIFALAGLALVVMEAAPTLSAFLPSLARHMPASLIAQLSGSLGFQLPELHGAMYSGGALVLLAVVLLFFTRLALPEGAVLVTVCFITLATAPWQYITLPALNACHAIKQPAQAPEAIPGFTTIKPSTPPASTTIGSDHPATL